MNNDQNNNIYNDYNNQNNNIYNSYKENENKKELEEKPYYIVNSKEIKKETRMSKMLLISFYLIAVVVGISILYVYTIDKYEFYLKEETVLLNNGSSYQIKLTPKNEEVFDYLNYRYEIEDKRVASVDRFGTVQAVGNGVTKLYIRYKYGLNKKVMTIKTEDIDIDNVHIISNEEIQRGEIKLKVNETKKISAVIEGREDINVSLKYRSSDESVARVDEYGNIIGVGEGIATIVGETESKVVIEIRVRVEEEEVSLEKIEFQEKEIIVKRGNKAQLTIIKTPENSKEEKITYKSDNSNVTVDNKGVVIGNKVGTSTITATSESGKVAFCVVHVSEEEIGIEKISLNIERETIKIGKSYQIIATISPSNATVREIIWESSNPNVATVENGKVLGKSVGETTITARTIDGKIRTSCVITVKDNKIYIENIKITENNIKITKGTKISLRTEISPSNATERILTWSSSNNNVATVDQTGNVHAKNTGKVTITVKTSNGKTATSSIEVTEESIVISRISISPTKVNINKGERKELSVTIEPSNATDRTISWKSSNTNVATVSNGIVYAKGGGEATITATSSNGKKATSKIIVLVPVTSISIKESAQSIKIGGQLKLETTIEPSDATNKTVSWTSSNTSVATVDSNGNVKGKSVGTATITAKTNNGKKANKSIKVEKTEILPVSVSVSPTSINLQVGATASVVATISPSNAMNKTVTWTSSNKSVATVDKNGLIKAKSIGTATITAKTSNGKTASSSVTVKSNEIKPTKISLNITNTTINKGDALTLVATIEPSNATNKTVTWTSSNKSVATVDSNGKVQGKSAGTATITAKTSNGKKATCIIIVKQKSPEVNSISLDKTNETVYTGNTLKLTTAISPNTAETTLTWKSSDISVATVNSTGKVSTLKSGTATITVTTSNGKTANCIITVRDKINIKTFDQRNKAVISYFNSENKIVNDIAIINNIYTDNECGSNDFYCDKPRIYNPGVTDEVNLYSYNATKDVKKYIKTLDSSLISYYMIPNNIYFWELKNNTTSYGYVKIIGDLRMINVDGVRNIRDFGGWNADGGTIKYGKIFRGANPNLNYTAKREEIFKHLGINVIADLRSENDFNMVANNFTSLKKINSPIDQYLQTERNRPSPRGIIKDIMKLVVDKKNVYFHCAIGKDRTGTVAYILEGILGMSREDRFIDYELTYFYTEKSDRTYPLFKKLYKKIDQYNSNNYEQEKFINWFLEESSNKSDDIELINNFRKEMIKGNPKIYKLKNGQAVVS